MPRSRACRSWSVGRTPVGRGKPRAARAELGLYIGPSGEVSCPHLRDLGQEEEGNQEVTIHVTIHNVLDAAGTIVLGVILYQVTTALIFAARAKLSGRRRRR